VIQGLHTAGKEGNLFPVPIYLLQHLLFSLERGENRALEDENLEE